MSSTASHKRRFQISASEKKLRQNDEEKVERNLLFLEQATAPSGGTHFVKRDQPS